MRTIVAIVLASLLATATGTLLAQPPAGRERPGLQRHDGGGRMSGADRQRLREDVQRQHANPRQASDPAGEERARRYAEWQRMSPAQRDDMRRDVHDTNRNLDRRGR